MDYSMITHKLDQIEGTNQGNAPNSMIESGPVTILESGSPFKLKVMSCGAERLRQGQEGLCNATIDRQPCVVGLIIRIAG